MTASRLLIDEPPIAIAPSLIRVLGGHDLACFAQQIHYKVQTRDAVTYDGQLWARATTAEWCDQVVLTPKQFKRVLAALVELGVVVRCQPTGSYDRTALTRIDYARLEALIGPDALVPNGTDRAGPNGTEPLVPNGTDVPLPEMGETLDNTPPAAAGEPELTINQRAQIIQRGYFDWVKAQTGHHPALGALAVMGVVRKLLERGRQDGDIKRALVALHNAGQSIAVQPLEAEMDGRRRRRSGPTSVNDALDALDLRYDEHGMMIP